MLNIPRSLRSLVSRPVFPAVAVATLALGLGVNAAVFSLTREVLLRPLPYRDADRLVRVFEVSRNQEIMLTSPADKVLASVTAFAGELERDSPCVGRDVLRKGAAVGKMREADISSAR